MDNVEPNTRDNTKNLQKQINDSLNKLVEEGKLTKYEAMDLKTSDPNPPTAWTAIKAHKPQKDFPARNIVSHIGCPQEPLAKELIRILKPLTSSCPYNVKNSTEIAQHLKNMNLDADDVFCSVDATALFPSIPIEECINLIADMLEQDDTLKDRTKLNVNDIRKLLHLCLSTSQFLYNDTCYTAKDSGPIGLSLMVTISDIWMTYTLKKATEIAQEKNYQLPSFLKKYVDDILAKFRIRAPEGMKAIDNYVSCLNEVHPRVQFTVELEDDKQITFLDCHIQRLPNGRVTTTVYRKSSDTNLVITPSKIHHFCRSCKLDTLK